MLIATPILTVLFRVFYLDRPSWPWNGGVPILQQKEGDVLVHMAIIVAFWMSGLAQAGALGVGAASRRERRGHGRVGPRDWLRSLR